MITVAANDYPQTGQFSTVGESALGGQKHPFIRNVRYQGAPDEETFKLRQENAKLTEIFQFAVREFEKKNQKIVFLEEELLKANAAIRQLRQENESLKKSLQEAEARNSLLNKMVFGKKTEKNQPQQPFIRSPKKRGGVKGHTGHGRNIPENLPVEEQIIDLPEDEKFCSCCGLPLEEMGLEEISSMIGVRKIYYLKKIKRKVYRKTCSCPNPIITAPAPAKLIPKGKFSTEFWVDTLINKYRNHLPVERQLAQMKEYGLIVSAGTIFGGFKKIYLLYLRPLYQALAVELRKATHLHADESGWHLFAKVDGKGNYNWFIWVFISKNVVLFVLHPTRSAKVPYKTLFDIDVEEIKNIDKEKLSARPIKRLSVDKFSSYKALANLGLVELIFCWAHQRREFIDLKIKYPELDGWAQAWIKYIGELYHINNQRIKNNPGEPIFEKHDKNLRKKIDEMWGFINQQYSHPAQTAITNSMKEHWKGLTLFVDNPEIPMDNNLAERTLRPMVLGRKNYWGNHALWAGELSVAMFSIIQTCLMHQISPTAYLTYYLEECVKRRTPPSQNEIESFLPHKLDARTKKRLRTFSPEPRAPP